MITSSNLAASLIPTSALGHFGLSCGLSAVDRVPV